MHILPLTIAVTAMFSSCSMRRNLQDGEYLVWKNKVVVEENKGLDEGLPQKELLPDIPFQQPNRRFLGVWALRAWFQRDVRGDDTELKGKSLRTWIKRSIGEAPVILDPTLTERSALAFQQYMYNAGFLDNSIEVQTDTLGKRSKITYILKPKEPYYIGNVVIDAGNPVLDSIIRRHQKDSKVLPGERFSIDELDQERKRLSTIFRNEGFYAFSPDYIRYTLDSFSDVSSINLVLEITKQVNGEEHAIWTVDSIEVYPDYRVQQNNDTAVNHQRDYKGLSIFWNGRLRYRPSLLRQACFYDAGEKFNASLYDPTVQRFASYGTFRFIDLKFNVLDTAKQQLIGRLYLTEGKHQSLDLDIEINHRIEPGLSGVSTSVGYTNRNLFRLADIFQIKNIAGVDAEFGRIDGALNNADFIVDISESFPKAILPFPIRALKRSTRIRTTFSTRYKFEQRFRFYRLHTISASVGYEWSKNKKILHTLRPIQLNVFYLPEAFRTADFEEKLLQFPSLARSFQESLIAGSNYTFLWSGIPRNNKLNIESFRFDAQMAGNLVSGFTRIIQGRRERGDYTVFGRPYAQYLRFEMEGKYARGLGRSKAQLASRALIGVGIPFGNSSIIPFISQFYVGGANSIRAFKLRSIGPGTYSDSLTLTDPTYFFDQSGDIKLEANIELRWSMNSWIKWALFYDLGNVWLYNRDEARPGGQFNKDFYRGIAMGWGGGLRLDFEYFVIRLDVGLPVHDPRYEQGERWRVGTYQWRDRAWRQQNLVFNLAIGYPF